MGNSSSSQSVQETPFNSFMLVAEFPPSGLSR